MITREKINISDYRSFGIRRLSWCEIVKCKYYKDGKCKDPNEYVNNHGDSVCGRRDDAIPYDDYIEIVKNNTTE